MVFNGIKIEPYDCLEFQSAEKNDYYMFPLLNRYRCLKSSRVLLDNLMNQCLEADQDPMFIEKCLQWIDDKYEVGFTTADYYSLHSEKSKPVLKEQPFVFPSNFTKAQIEEFLCT